MNEPTMTLEEFGRTVKQKYPVYSTYSDTEIGQKMIEKYPVYKNKIKQDSSKSGLETFANLPVLKQLGQLGQGGLAFGAEIGKAGLGIGELALKGADYIPGVDTSGLVKNIQSIKENIYEKPFEEIRQTIPGKVGEVAGIAVPFFAGSGAITKGQKVATGLVDKIPAVSKLGKFAKGATGVGARAGVEGVATYGTELARTGGDTESAETAGLLATGASSVLGGIGSLYRGGKELLRTTNTGQKILSSVSDVPVGAIKEVVDGGIIQGSTPEASLLTARNAVKNLRKKMTSTWQAEVPKIVEENKNLIYVMPDTQIDDLVKVVDEFGVDKSLLPKNPKNVPVDQAINLMKSLNEVDNLAAKQSPKGAILRRLKKELRENVLNTFGGKGSSLDNLWKTYSIKSEILENANNIVNAYGTKPVQTVTAKNRLMAIFDENKSEFLNAIKELEKEMGVSLVPGVASSKVLGQTTGTLKAPGGLPTKSTLIDSLLRSTASFLVKPARILKPIEAETSPSVQRLFGNYLPSKNANTAVSTIPNITNPIKNNQAPTINPNIVPKNESIPTIIDETSLKVKSLADDGLKYDSHPTFDGLRMELEISEPGYRYNRAGNGYTAEQVRQTGATSAYLDMQGVPSTFPQWMPEELRSKKLFKDFQDKWMKYGYVEEPIDTAPVKERRLYRAIKERYPEAVKEVKRIKVDTTSNPVVDEAFGVVAGFETDENGNITYNPAEGAFGALGTVGLNKVMKGKKSLPKLNVSDDLVNEARKYKTADEFVKAQGTRTGVEVRDKIGTKLQDPYTAEYLPTNPDGTITLYHSTTKEGAEKIKQSGIFGSKTEGGDIYFTTNKKGYGGIGKDKDVVLAFNVDPKKVNFDDVYRGELHLKGNNADIGGIKPNQIKTKSQLIDIWEKANNK